MIHFCTGFPVTYLVFASTLNAANKDKSTPPSIFRQKCFLCMLMLLRHKTMKIEYMYIVSFYCIAIHTVYIQIYMKVIICIISKLSAMISIGRVVKSFQPRVHRYRTFRGHRPRPPLYIMVHKCRKRKREKLISVRGYTLKSVTMSGHAKYKRNSLAWKMQEDSACNFIFLYL